MPAPSTRTLAERLAFLVRWMVEGICHQYVGGPKRGCIPRPLVPLIMERLKTFRDRLNRLAERIIAGTFAPRRHAPRRAQANPKPRPESPFQRFGWLDAMLPPAMAQEQRGNIFTLVNDPEIAALIAVAPAEMGRLLRPLCWMVKLKPPAILARPKLHPEAGPPPPPPKYQRPLPPPLIPGPANTLGLHPIQFLPIPPPPKPA